VGKEEFKKNRTRCFEIYGLNPTDRRYNIHHIIERSDYKKNKRFWDSLEPNGRFDIDSISNLCPLLVTEHAQLHRYLDGLEPLPIKRRKRGKRK